MVSMFVELSEGHSGAIAGKVEESLIPRSQTSPGGIWPVDHINFRRDIQSKQSLGKNPHPLWLIGIIDNLFQNCVSICVFVKESVLSKFFKKVDVIIYIKGHFVTEGCALVDVWACVHIRSGFCFGLLVLGELGNGFLYLIALGLDLTGNVCLSDYLLFPSALVLDAVALLVVLDFDGRLREFLYDFKALRVSTKLYPAGGLAFAFV